MSEENRIAIEIIAPWLVPLFLFEDLFQCFYPSTHPFKHDSNVYCPRFRIIAILIVFFLGQMRPERKALSSMIRHLPNSPTISRLKWTNFIVFTVRVTLTPSWQEQMWDHLFLRFPVFFHAKSLTSYDLMAKCSCIYFYRSGYLQLYLSCIMIQKRVFKLPLFHHKAVLCSLISRKYYSGNYRSQ
jgi:hypothetical protein